MLGQRAQLGIVAQAQHFAVAGRCDREAVLVVFGIEGAVLGIQAQRDTALLQRLAVVAAEEGHQQLAFKQGVGRIPLDVEELCIGTAPSPLQHIQPPGIATAADGHVVGDYVQDQPHTFTAQRLDQAAQGRLAAQFGIDARGVDDVVAMHRAGARRKQGRGVNMADAEAGEVADQFGGVIESEAAVELQPQGRAEGFHRGFSPRAWRRASARHCRRRALSGWSSSVALSPG